MLRAAEGSYSIAVGTSREGGQARQDPIHLVWMVNKVVRLPPCALCEAAPWGREIHVGVLRNHAEQTARAPPLAGGSCQASLPGTEQWQGLPRKA